MPFRVVQRQRQDIESERLIAQQQLRALNALSIPIDAAPTPAKPQKPLFHHTPTPNGRVDAVCVTPTFARLARSLARAAEVASSVATPDGSVQFAV